MNETIRLLAASALIVCVTLGLLAAVFGNWPIAALAAIGGAGWIVALRGATKP